MKRRALLSLTLISMLLAAPAGAAPSPGEPDENHPQPELAKEKLVIETRDHVPHVFNVEMALTPDQQIVGLMLRPSVAPDGGMLFDWGTPRESDMWMKNTLAPLDMVFIENDGRIHRIVENTVPQSLAVIRSDGPVRATLELAAGVTKKLNIRVGDKVEQRLFSKTPKD